MGSNSNFFAWPRLKGGVLLLFLKVTAITGVITIICQLYFQYMVFDKFAITQGEFWRLVSCHFVHSSFSHGLWDVLAISASLTWLSIYSKSTILPSLVLGIVAVSILLVSDFFPFQFYCGLSGILFSPLIVATYYHAKHNKGFIGKMPFLFVFIKLVTDLISNDTLVVNTDWSVFPESHLAGAIAGLVVTFHNEVKGKNTGLPYRGFKSEYHT